MKYEIRERGENYDHVVSAHDTYEAAYEQLGQNVRQFNRLYPDSPQGRSSYPGYIMEVED